MRTSAVLLALAATPLFAQTVHHTAQHTGAEHHAALGGCITVPELSSKIPALPAGSACPKALYTITRHPSITLDYASPMLSPQLRDMLDEKSETFSLGYVDTRIGTGPLAEPHKWYTVHYTGYLADGTKFDSSVDRGEPISFPYGSHRVIEGWDTGFEGMHVGGKRRLFVPYELGYGENGRPPIPPRAELIFDVELVAQSDSQPTPPRPRPEPAQPGAQGLPQPGARPGAGAPVTPGGTPPVNPSTPATSTQPTQPSTTNPPKP